MADLAAPPVPALRLDRLSDDGAAWHDVSLGGDGGCTGLPSGLVNEALLKCCVEHDAGGRDGALLDCSTDALPGVPAAIICLVIFLMALLRPVYNQLQRWGWVK
jgi:hypothetical protein